MACLHEAQDGHEQRRSGKAFGILHRESRPRLDEESEAHHAHQLVTNDAYVLGALVVCKSLRDTGTRHAVVVLAVTEGLSPSSLDQLRAAFDDVVAVSAPHNRGAANLSLIGRPDLLDTLTKLHAWSLTAYARVLYLDADTLVLRDVDHLLNPGLDLGQNIAAAPELGFPDCFNAGVMLLRPNASVFDELVATAGSHPSFDGGDQGLLNVFFGDGTRGHPSTLAVRAAVASEGHENDTTPRRNWYRLSYTYNMEMHRVYRMYISAVARYRDEHKILHFIGKEKPWHFQDGEVDGGDGSAYSNFYADMVGKWWAVRRSLGV